MAADDHRSSHEMAEEAVNDHRKLRKVISSLYDADMERRLIAAKALGEIARIEPELIRQRWERIFSAFDDTMTCWGAPEGLGEIGRNLPQIRAKILLFLKRFRRDECSCQGYIWAVCRIGQVERERIEETIPDLIGYLDSENVCMLGQAIWSLGELEVREAAERMRGLLEDGRETWLFENDSVNMKTIGEIAAEALAKLA